MTHASTGQHWYAPDGTPTYEVPSADGKKMIKATLRQARTMGLFPGVTGVMDVMDKPGLTRWKMRQSVLAALTLPREEGESDDDYVSRVLSDGMQEAADARDIGTLVHAAIQEFYQTGKVDPEWAGHIAAIRSQVDPLGQDWEAEKAVANRMWGYGTKADLASTGWILDFKGKDVLTKESCAIHKEHAMQLAATRGACGERYSAARCGIVFFSRMGDPEALLVHVHERELQRGMARFIACLNLWKVDRDYYPGECSL